MPSFVMPTIFQQRIYAFIKRIPRGRVTTYGLVAQAVRCRSARAVGQALKRNPYAPRVPCHRVIASDLTLGGFQGRRDGPALARKRRLLAREGVQFDHCGRLQDPRRLWRRPSP